MVAQQRALPFVQRADSDECNTARLERRQTPALAAKTVARKTERCGEHHPVHVAGRARLRTVQIPVRVEPDRAARAVLLAQAREGSQGDRVVTTEHDGNEPVARCTPHELRDPLRGLLDLGQKAGMLVSGLRCFCDSSFDVSQVHVLVSELGEA